MQYMQCTNKYCGVKWSFDNKLIENNSGMKELRKNTKGYKILTPNGFQPFAGVSMMGEKYVIKLIFEHSIELKCTFNHKLYVDLTTVVTADELRIGDTILTSKGNVRLVAKEIVDFIEPVYDVIEVSNGHRYYTNTLLSSNCKFLVFDETLINSIKLSQMDGKAPILNMGQVRWYKKPLPQYTYCVALDPSMGTGGDYAAIEVFELPTYEQVAEWQHNTTSIPGQIKILTDICKYIQYECNQTNNIYWSVENNGIGEAALIVINDFGEENIPGLFISEPMRKGHVRKFRKGFNTTYSTKITACSRLKTMIENDKMIICSKPFISELKGFIASGSSFQAKTGLTDDLVSAALLAIRMMSVLKDWDPRVYNTFTQMSHDENYEIPMPIFMSSI